MASPLDEPGARERFAATLPNSRWWAQVPLPIQMALLCLTDVREVYFGGAAGGAKSSALLMVASQFADNPHNHALILRRTFQDLSLPGALIPRSHEWWGSTAAKYDPVLHRWTFPSGATISFGYADSERDIYRYSGSEFTCVCVDEAGQIREEDLDFIKSRMRTAAPPGVRPPIMFRLASNPEGVSLSYLREKFVNHVNDRERFFLPSKLADNPYLNEDYRQQLLAAFEGDVLRLARYLDGDHDAVEPRLFDTSCIPGWQEPPLDVTMVRAWDCAYTASSASDYTAGVLMAFHRASGLSWVVDVDRFRLDTARRDARMRRVAEADNARYGDKVLTIVEVFGGKNTRIETTARWRALFSGYRFLPTSMERQSKAERAAPVAAAMGEGRVLADQRAKWFRDFRNELDAFKGETRDRDDQVDSLAYAFNRLTRPAPGLAPALRR